MVFILFVVVFEQTMRSLLSSCKTWYMPIIEKKSIIIHNDFLQCISYIYWIALTLFCLTFQSTIVTETYSTKLCFRRVIPRYYMTALRSMIEHTLFEKNQNVLWNLVRETHVKSGNFIFQNNCSPKEKLAGDNIFAHFRKDWKIEMSWKDFSQSLIKLLV